MKLKVIILLAILHLTIVVSVPENWTKKCEQSSFCRRCRGVKGDFEVKSSTQSDENVSFEILNKKTNKLLVMKLECLENNSFHFEIDEKEPLKKRFRLEDVVIDTAKIKKNRFQYKSDASTSTITCGTDVAVVYFTPFKIEFKRGDELAVTVNGKGFMTYEHLRQKAVPTALDDEELDEDPDSWEETFMGVVDSKPNGPEAVALDFTFDQSEVLFGIPEHHDTFALRRTSYGEPYRLYTVDMTLFEVDSRMPNYGAIPVIYGHAKGRTAGIFWHNSADTYVDILDTQSAQFITEAGIIDVYVFLGPSPNDAFSQYTKITGVGNLPQLFTLAYHQSRWGYMSQDEILEIVEKFDDFELPLDTMWLDIDYTDEIKYFTWNKVNFSKPLELMSKLKESGRRLVHIIDPHIRADPNYFFYNETLHQNLLVKTADNGDYYGRCWPGNSSYLDYFNVNASKYYADQYLLENFKDNSVETGIWNDMNEPAVFDVPEKTFPRDNRHYRTVGSTDYVEHRLIHNIYGFLHTKATFDGLERRSKDYRPYILTRSFFAGSQKYTTVWTGDNTADWPYLKASIQACLAISVSGISFCGSDIGGFFGNPDDDLFIRWTQAAAFQPFFRNHAEKNTKYREPYLWKNETMSLVRKAMRKRYELLPLWYTMFYEHEKNGYPVMRPMLANYPNDPNIFTIDTQYMLSDKLLVSPVLEPHSNWVIVRFPSTDGAEKGDIWYHIYDNYKKYEAVGTQAVSADGDKIPVFQRGGTIIPAKLEPKSASVHMRNDPLTIFIAVDENLKADGNVYIDDETSLKYRDGAYKMVSFSFQNATLTVSEEGSKDFNSAIEKVYFAGIKMQKYARKECTIGNAKHSVNVEVKEVADEYFYADIKESLTTCETSWTLTLNNSGMIAIMSRGLLMSIIILNVIKKLFF